MSCFLTLTRILDFKAPGLPGYHTTELATEGSAVSPMYFDLGETVDTVPCGVGIAKSTETYVATRIIQPFSRLERKTLDTFVRVMKKKPQGIVFNLH